MKLESSFVDTGHVGGVPAANRFNAWECARLKGAVVKVRIQ